MAITQTSPAYSYPYPYQVVFDALVGLLPTLGMKIVAADPASGTIKASSPMGMMTWGENISVRLWGPDATTTGIIVESSLKFGLVDWGKNQKNLDKIFAALGSYLDSYFGQHRSPGAPEAPGAPGAR